jgi:hypothetical protein
MNINNHYRLNRPLPDLIRNATLMGYHKSPKFIEFLVNKGYTFSGIQDENKVSNLLRAIALFEEKYGDNVDLQWIKDGNRNYAPVFKVVYPKFNITNSQGQSHQIRDLFVLHRFSYSSFGTFTIKRPEGGRLSKTVEEIVSHYQQSHLTRHSEWIKDPFHATDFCLGNDTDVSRMLAEFEAELDWDRLELYLYCVDSMVTWESLEGVPFRYISSISNSTSTSVSGFDSNYADRIIRQILNTKIPLDVDFYVKDNRYKIATNRRASDFIKKIVLDTLTVSGYKRILVTVHPSDCQKYLAMGTTAISNSMEVEAKDQYTIFRGKKVYAKVIKEKQEKEKQVSIEDYIIYPKFLDYVCRELEYKIYEKAVANSAARYISAISDANRSVASDTVSL